MTKKIVLCLSMVAVAVSGCGKSYKAIQPQSTEINDVAAESKEKQAQNIILQDVSYTENQSTVLSQILKTELLGVSARLTNSGEKSILEVSVLDSKSVDCKEKTSRFELETKKMDTELQKINSLGRVRCLETACDHLLLVVEKRRNVKSEGSVNGSIIDGTVAVLLKKNEDGVYSPLNTESQDFLQVNSTEVALQACVEQKNTDAQKKKESFDKDVVAEQKRLHAKRLISIAERIYQIDQRVQKIDEKMKEVLKSGKVTDEPKALGSERSKLIAEKTKLNQEQASLLAKSETADTTKIQPVPEDPSL